MGNSASHTSYSSEPFDGLPRVQPSEFETSPVKRDRTLKHLLRANHHNYAVLYNRDRFHNHLPHVLGSAYLLGAPAEHLQKLYDEDITTLEPWRDAPQEITREDWRDFLGQRDYQRAFMDFFEDQMVRHNYDWRGVVREYALEGKEPLLHGMIGGLGHPLIHLGYAYELNNRDLAMEALVLGATNYNFLHKYLDEAFPMANFKSTKGQASALELISELRTDSRLDGLFEHTGADNIEKLFKEREDVVLEYFNRYNGSDITAAHRELSKVATLLLIATDETNYDFFICHLLTTSYAIRVLLPELPSKFAESLVKAHWLFILVVYCIQLRPEIRPELIDKVDASGKTWNTIVKQAFAHKSEDSDVEDTHYLKAVRALKDYAGLFEEDEKFYTKAAVKFAWGFKHWGGFGAANAGEVN